MTLKPHASYPQARAYVLTLHRDAAPGEGAVIGRLEHVVSGKQFHFATADELVACLAQTTNESADAGPAGADYAEIP
jgi:hypothetical protein